MDWDFVKRLRDAVTVKLLLKGIVTREDAETRRTTAKYKAVRVGAIRGTCGSLLTSARASLWSPALQMPTHSLTHLEASHIAGE